MHHFTSSLLKIKPRTLCFCKISQMLSPVVLLVLFLSYKTDIFNYFYLLNHLLKGKCVVIDVYGIYI